MKPAFENNQGAILKEYELVAQKVINSMAK
jgi:hypothetical protein